jgi:hypothetical protein
VACADINECAAKSKCQCPECKCTNTWGSYDCQCSGGLLYFAEHDTCISECPICFFNAVKVTNAKFRLNTR